MSRPKPSVAMTPEEIAAFLSACANPAAVCVPDGKGGLVARMARYHMTGSDPAQDLNLSLMGAAAYLPAGEGVCVLVDTYPSYAGICGAMLHGRLQVDGNEARLEARRVSGFDFTKLKK